MPQLEVHTYASQLIWLAITFAVLYWVMARVALPRVAEVLSDRHNRISGDLETAERLKIEAETALAEYEKALEGARAQAQTAIGEAREAAAGEAARRNAESAAQLQAKISEAESRIASAKSAAIGNIRGVASEAARAATQKLIGVEVDDQAVADAVAAELGGGE